MFRLVCLCAMVLLVQGQRSAKAARYTDDPRVAAILSEERYLSGDGTFGAAYTQEDGVDFKEESDAAGNRKGSYSYVDPSGQRRTISYTAGKNGFVASGDHLPVGPAAPQAPAQAPRYQPAPQPQYQSAPQQQYQSAPQQQYQPAPQYSGQSSRGAPNEDDGQYYPELYENENSARSQYSGQARYTPVQQAAPQPQYQPAPQQQYSGVQQQSYVAPKVQNQYNTAPQQFSGVQSEPRPQQLFAPEERTPAPARFFPPGKLDLNRSPDGYSYSFSSKF